MATNNTTSNLSDFLRKMYGKLDDELLYKDSGPFFMMVKKDTSFSGATYNHTVMYGDIGGGSANFASASNGTSPVLTKQFSVPLTLNYVTANIDRLLIKTGKGAGSNADALKTIMDSAVRAASNRLAKQLLNAGGALGQVNSVADTQTIPLLNKADVNKFNVGDVLAFASATSGGTLRGGGATTTTIVGVDRNNGTLSGSAYLNAGSVTLNDWLVPAGDYGNTCKAVGDWVTATSPSAGESFLGVDRSADARLYGIAYNGSGNSVEDALINGCILAGERGGRPDTCVIGFRKYGKLMSELSDRKRFTDVRSANGKVGFKAIEIDMPTGPLTVVCDPFMRDTTIFLLRLEDWVLQSAGATVEVFADDVPMLRIANQDAYSVTVGGYSNLLCKRPGHQVRITMQASTI